MTAVAGHRAAHLAIAVALALAALLVAVELQRGALGDDPLAVADPCQRRDAPGGEGLDGQAQRIGVAALDAAACRLGTSREALALSVAGTIEDGRPIGSSVERALRDGFSQAIEREEAEGRLDSVAAFLLGQAAERAPGDWIRRALDLVVA